MKSRIVSFDYLRTLAIGGVLICHYCHNYEKLGFIGHYCGNTFVTLFIVMSGMLLGITWNSKGRPSYGADFIKKRFCRLSWTYYPFLVLMFLFLFFVEGYSLSVKDILMQLCYLSWFDKIPNFGHLYFLTMIALCYIATFVFSRFYKNLLYNIRVSRPVLVFLSGILAFIIDYIIENKGLPGYMLMWLWLFIVVLFYAPKIIIWSKNLGLLKLIPIVALINAFALCLFYFDLYDSYNHSLSKWLGAVCCVSILILGICIWKNSVGNKLISVVSSISFEIYLMFNIVSEGNYSLMMFIDNPMLALVTYIAVSIVLGYALNLLVGGVRFCYSHIVE